MSINWRFPADRIALGGTGRIRISEADALRQQRTAEAILASLQTQPGVVLADEVGMGKTYVALAVMVSSLLAERATGRPNVVMTPPGLVTKWAREWQQFKAVCCRNPDDLAWVRDARISSPTEFFNVLDDPKHRRPHLIFMTTGCFSAGLEDGWTKLALVRLARRKTRLNSEAKKNLFRWAATLSRLKSWSNLTADVIALMMDSDIDNWADLLAREGVIEDAKESPVPEHLRRYRDKIDFGPLVDVLQGGIPSRRGATSDDSLKEARWGFNRACQYVYWNWLGQVKWQAPLLVLDEAHHAKNDSTKLASLFRSEDSTRLLDDSQDKPLLFNKFDRMLFLTATPFQLGHHELIRVLRSFASARWDGESPPSSSREAFLKDLDVLTRRLDENRAAGRRLDKLWGRLSSLDLGAATTDAVADEAVTAWWNRAANQPRLGLEAEIVDAVTHFQKTKTAAEKDSKHPWQGLSSWVIRHNRPRFMPATPTELAIPRRRTLVGAALARDEASDSTAGTVLTGSAALPFLLAARAQGELAASKGRGRALFAEGLCSTYEAFHHTRDEKDLARDTEDDGHAAVAVTPPEGAATGLVPIEWYEERIFEVIPSVGSSKEERRRHPKLEPVLKRTVDLWLGGEKVLIFCFYRQTVRALREHLTQLVDDAIAERAATRLGLGPGETTEARRALTRISRRLATAGGPFHKELSRLLNEPFDRLGLILLKAHQRGLVSLLTAYVRNPAFIARYLPLNDPALRQALFEGDVRAEVTRAGLDAFASAFTHETDGSKLTMMRRIEEFLEFAHELAERAQHHRPEEASERTGLDEYIDAVSGALKGDDGDNEDRKVRTRRVVSMVYGQTPREQRERVMLAFNSPLFPEILISSAVLGEGVDLHRFCRYVIHHDLCWNPSTLEQRTGRLDRIRCKAEVSRRPITIYEPFIAGSADERMFRVVRDRERWFQVVMGQRYEFDEAGAEAIALRVPLPEGLAKELVFDLSRPERG